MRVRRIEYLGEILNVVLGRISLEEELEITTLAKTEAIALSVNTNQGLNWLGLESRSMNSLPIIIKGTKPIPIDKDSVKDILFLAQSPVLTTKPSDGTSRLKQRFKNMGE